MPRFTLQPNGAKNIKTPNRWLNIFDATGVFVVSIDGLSDMQVKKDWQLDVETVTAVEIRNDSAEPVTIEIENTPIPVKASGGGAVTIEGKPVIQRIEESIQVTADATVENGSMRQISPNAALATADITVPAGQTVKVADARPDAFNRKVLLQTTSDTVTSVRVGFTAGLVAGEGILMRGYKESPATVDLFQDTAVYVHNESQDAAKVSVTEVWRA